jgi:hypothetical protein
MALEQLLASTVSRYVDSIPIIEFRSCLNVLQALTEFQDDDEAFQFIKSKGLLEKPPHWAFPTVEEAILKVHPAGSRNTLVLGRRLRAIRSRFTEDRGRINDWIGPK